VPRKPVASTGPGPTGRCSGWSRSPAWPEATVSPEPGSPTSPAYRTVTVLVTVVTPGTCGLSILVATVPAPAAVPRTVTE